VINTEASYLPVVYWDHLAYAISKMDVTELVQWDRRTEYKEGAIDST
jgi:hypothetical protein